MFNVKLNSAEFLSYSMLNIGLIATHD